ncbi:hypothetical protein BJ742DRAFT_737354 [Cladochytrium replicatum]|nr:hypothetical protein BJ742DRAFT_737354 [Cladochytrium replicatum]
MTSHHTAPCKSPALSEKLFRLLKLMLNLHQDSNRPMNGADIYKADGNPYDELSADEVSMDLDTMFAHHTVLINSVVVRGLSNLNNLDMVVDAHIVLIGMLRDYAITLSATTGSEETDIIPDLVPLQERRIALFKLLEMHVEYAIEYMQAIERVIDVLSGTLSVSAPAFGSVTKLDLWCDHGRSATWTGVCPSETGGKHDADIRFAWCASEHHLQPFTLHKPDSSFSSIRQRAQQNDSLRTISTHNLVQA